MAQSGRHLLHNVRPPGSIPTRGPFFFFFPSGSVFCLSPFCETYCVVGFLQCVFVKGWSLSVRRRKIHFKTQCIHTGWLALCMLEVAAEHVQAYVCGVSIRLSAFISFAHAATFLCSSCLPVYHYSSRPFFFGLRKFGLGGYSGLS